MLLKNENPNCLYKWLMSLVMVVVLYSTSLAQSPTQVRDDFSKDELESFVDAYEEVQVIQEESDKQVMTAIESGDLTMERFNEILAQQQDPGKVSDASAEEMAAFNSAAQTIIKERQKVEMQMVDAIEEEGIDINTYQEIMIAYQQSPKVQKKINKILEQ
ncbi:DUF4168 domain-containing protein [Fulvivirga kasyanovii]|uniref:DUF4168 domain-containing protein n=1 Tax=Fulvivirga kasyanovii TaxID=396812 RepID=A0ABW9RWB9_9BACT|nr:DUF4168 domain-containing protein [Fulvivirga kasyanovii]MTI28001.1 DUF4168 domain-containing protein [Fulvivirga kasyanovii]